MLFCARKETGKSCEKSCAEEEDVCSNMKQTCLDQSTEYSSMLLGEMNYLWTLGEE